METIRRRHFIKGLAGVTLNLADQAIDPTQAQTTYKIADILGLHDVPAPGGSANANLLFDDMRRLGIKKPGHSLTCVDPGGAVIDRAVNEEIRMLVRPSQPGDRFDEQKLRFTLDKFKGVNVPIIPFNEPNHPFRPITPDDLIEDLLKATRIILQYHQRVVFPPLCPYNNAFGLNENRYFETCIEKLIEKTSRQFLMDNFIMSDHVYLFLNSEQPWARTERKYMHLQETYGISLPWEITEAGIEIPGNKQTDDAWIAEQLITLIQTPIPEMFQGWIRSFNLWLYANYAQRDLRLLNLSRAEDRREQDSFEISSLRRRGGETMAFHKIAQLMQRL